MYRKQLKQTAMREIKFRAWDTLQGGKFEYWDSKTNRYDGIFWSMIKNTSFKEPQQFTGTTDKNGKEIYEGDIVRYRGGKKPRNQERGFVTSVVVFRDRMFTVENNQSIYIDSAVIMVSEVLGNIHENPDLLK